MFKMFVNEAINENRNNDIIEESDGNASLNEHIIVSEVINNIKSPKSQKAHGMDYI